MPRIAVLSDLARAIAPGVHPVNADLARRRLGFWAEIARLRGLDLAVHDAADLSAIGGALAWIDLPLLSRVAYRELFDRACASGARSVLDTPDDVEQVLGLDRSQPILERAGLPVPRTALVTIDDETAAAVDSPAAVRRLLTERMYEALFAAGIDPHQGVYVRGFSSSVKSTNPESFFGDNQADIEATAFEVIRHLRDALEVSGLALREHLDLERIELPAGDGGRGGARVPFEVRITVLGGRAIAASYHGPFAALVDPAREVLAGELEARRGRVETAVRALLPAILAAGLPNNYVADLAFIRGGDAVLLELNPLYAAGYNVPAAHALVVAALASDLSARAGEMPMSWSEVLEISAQLEGERVEESAGVWLLAE